MVLCTELGIKLTGSNRRDKQSFYCNMSSSKAVEEGLVIKPKSASLKSVSSIDDISAVNH